MTIARFRSRSIEILIIFGCIFVLVLLVAPVFSTRPSKSSLRNWEANYSSILPVGYSDFRGHWQSHDVGVHIFSFRYPHGLVCEEVLDDFADRLSGYRLDHRSPSEIAFRRSVTYSDPNGFDEFRFVCVPSEHRVYVMFANLDSEMESHPFLVEQFHEIVSGESR